MNSNKNPRHLPLYLYMVNKVRACCKHSIQIINGKVKFKLVCSHRLKFCLIKQDEFYTIFVSYRKTLVNFVSLMSC